MTNNKIYKYVPFFMLLLVLSLNSCSEQEFEQESNNEIVNLTFDASNQKSSSSSQGNLINISAVLEYEGDLPKLKSEDIIEIDITIETTTQNSYGYVLKNPHTGIEKSSGIVNPGLSMGYGFDGTCFVYGTFFTDDNGNTLFWECGELQGCIGFTRYCPSGPNEAFAYNHNIL